MWQPFLALVGLVGGFGGSGCIRCTSQTRESFACRWFLCRQRRGYIVIAGECWRSYKFLGVCIGAHDGERGWGRFPWWRWNCRGDIFFDLLLLLQDIFQSHACSCSSAGYLRLVLLAVVWDGLNSGHRLTGTVVFTWFEEYHCSFSIYASKDWQVPLLRKSCAPEECGDSSQATADFDPHFAQPLLVSRINHCNMVG